MSAKNALYAQSGGVTSVINASACGLIESLRENSQLINKIYAAQNGILGVLNEELIDLSNVSTDEIKALKHTPSGAFGSCRYKLKPNSPDMTRILDVFKAHDIGYFFYNGGGDSQDTANKIASLSQAQGMPVQCIGIPKTVDNDLPFTDNCPGFASVAKYIAVSTLEASLDVASMASSSTKVFILEVMGRHAGWIAAASGLAGKSTHDAPHIILFPEVILDLEKFLKRVKYCVETYGYCVIVTSEGVCSKPGVFLSQTTQKDAFGHAQLGGVAPLLANMIHQAHGYKYHWAVADYLQRAARHLASTVDVEQAYALGRHAVQLALNGMSGQMPVITRLHDFPYRWKVDSVQLTDVANQERKLPDYFIREDGFGITQACRTYLQPLIEGEAYPPYQNGLPQYIRLNHTLVEKKLEKYRI